MAEAGKAEAAERRVEPVVETSSKRRKLDEGMAFLRLKDEARLERRRVLEGRETWGGEERERRSRSGQNANLRPEAIWRPRSSDWLKPRQR